MPTISPWQPEHGTGLAAIALHRCSPEIIIGNINFHIDTLYIYIIHYCIWIIYKYTKEIEKTITLNKNLQNSIFSILESLHEVSLVIARRQFTVWTWRSNGIYTNGMWTWRAKVKLNIDWRNVDLEVNGQIEYRLTECGRRLDHVHIWTCMHTSIIVSWSERAAFFSFHTFSSFFYKEI